MGGLKAYTGRNDGNILLVLFFFSAHGLIRVVEATRVGYCERYSVVMGERKGRVVSKETGTERER